MIGRLYIQLNQKLRGHRRIHDTAGLNLVLIQRKLPLRSVLDRKLGAFGLQDDFRAAIPCHRKIAALTLYFEADGCLPRPGQEDP